jgi:hypothetical protein
MTVARANHTATVLKDGRVLVAGGYGPGYEPLASAEIFDPGSDRWTSVPDMNDAHVDHTATLLEDGRVLVFAGNESSILTAEIYDPVSDQWTPIPADCFVPHRHRRPRGGPASER